MAGRPRKPALELLVTGQWRRDRHGGRSLSPTAPLGQPPKHLSAEARRCWREVAGSAEWLRHPDRGLLEVYVQLMAQQRSDFVEMSAAKLTLLVSLGARLGLSPVDRTRLRPLPERPVNCPARRDPAWSCLICRK